MNRSAFLKKGLSSLGILVVAPIIASCDKETVSTTTTTTGTTTSTGTSNGSSSSDCNVTNTETAGPFPIKDAASLVKTDIRGDRNGVATTVKITIKNKTSSCAALAGVLVDIWHCDAKGDYSEYGVASLNSAHWLRGRQTTDANGLVSFTTIFPGWYSGRAPHIHVHIYSSTGKTLLVSQIAFNKAICDTIYTTATDYKSRGTANTTNEKDNVFQDGFSNELCSITGSVNNGYALTHTIVVSA